MSRPTTGIITTTAATSLNIKDLRKAGVFVHGQIITAIVQMNSNEMKIEADFRGTLPFIRLLYSFNGQTQDYIVRIEVRTSNLNKGKIMYFICPVSGYRCRRLYRTYGSPIFKARKAYRRPIYYASQLTGGVSRYNSRYWQIERQLERLYERRQYLTYKGKPTRLAKRIDRLTDRQDKYDRLRFSPVGMSAFLLKILQRSARS